MCLLVSLFECLLITNLRFTVTCRLKLISRNVDPNRTRPDSKIASRIGLGPDRKILTHQYPWSSHIGLLQVSSKMHQKLVKCIVGQWKIDIYWFSEFFPTRFIQMTSTVEDTGNEVTSHKDDAEDSGTDTKKEAEGSTFVLDIELSKNHAVLLQIFAIFSRKNRFLLVLL